MNDVFDMEVEDFEVLFGVVSGMIVRENNEAQKQLAMQNAVQLGRGM